MIVTPDLLDHPKYLRLRKRVGSDAIEHLLRLWGHCQQNQKGAVWTEDAASPEYVEMVCRWAGEPGTLYGALLECRFLEIEEGAIIIHDWATYNRGIMANWSNGKTGGRHPKPTPRKPMGNPRVSHGLPMAQPMGGSERSEGIGLEGEGTRAPSDSEPVYPTPAEIVTFGAMSAGVPEDFCRHYHEKKAIARTWLNGRGVLVDWRRELVSWWADDRATWEQRKARASAGKEAELARIAEALASEQDPLLRAELKKQREKIQ